MNTEIGIFLSIMSIVIAVIGIRVAWTQRTQIQKIKTIGEDSHKIQNSIQEYSEKTHKIIDEAKFQFQETKNKTNLAKIIKDMDKTNELILFLNFFRNIEDWEDLFARKLEDGAKFTFVLLDDDDEDAKKHAEERLKEITKWNEIKKEEFDEFHQHQINFKNKIIKILKDNDLNRESKVFTYNTSPRMPIFILKKNSVVEWVYLGFYVNENLIEGISIKIPGSESLAGHIVSYVEDKIKRPFKIKYPSDSDEKYPYEKFE